MTGVLGLQLAQSTGAAAPPPTSLGVQHLVGASVNYAGHPTLPAGTLQQDVATFESQLQSTLGVSGLQLAGPHGYSGNTWPSTFSATAVSWAPGAGYGYSWINVKTGGYSQWAGAATGSKDALLTGFVNSVPDGHTCVLIVDHEPENDATQPSSDGGTWENQYGPLWSQMQARFAGLVATLNRPNVYLAVVLMGATFPTNGQPGSLGINSRNPENWNAWRYMSAAAKARTILAPDVYTKMLDDAGTSNSYDKLATKLGSVVNYTTAAGWGVQWYGITEHTVNNDVNASDAHVAAAWRDDVRATLRNLGTKFSYYLVFNTSSGLASGTNGWVDGTQELTEFGAMDREFNFGAGGASGTTGIAYRASATATANNSTPSVTIPSTAQVGDYALIGFSCSNTVTVTDPAGWTVLVSTDSNNLRTRLYRRLLTSGQPGSAVTPTMSATSRWEMDCTVYSGVHATTPEDVAVAVSTSNVTNTVQTTPTVTTVTAGATVVQRVANRGTTTLVTAAWTPPAGWTMRTQVYPGAAPGASAAVADKANAAVGTYGGDTWTSDAALGSYVGITLALRPA